MLTSCQHVLNYGLQTLPGFGKIGHSARSGRRSGVVDSAEAVHDLAPRFKRTIFFQPVQHRIDYALADCDHRIRAAADCLNDLVAVHFLFLKQPENQEFGNAVHEIRVGFAGWHRGP